MPFKKVDTILLGTTLALVLIGLFMIISASPTLGLRYGDPLYFTKRHIFFLFLGVGALWWGLRISLDQLKNHFFLWYVLATIALLLLFVPHVGQTIGGAVRWINLGFFSVQPAELAKMALIIFLAAFLGGRTSTSFHIVRDFFIPGCAILFYVALLMAQPDMGTALVIMTTGAALLWVSGTPKKFFYSAAAFGIAGITALAVSAPYRLKRLTAFLDPWKDPQGSGFHIIQSLLAVGSGGVWGLGIGNSRQKFSYVPQHISDFIYAILSEETGFIGAATVAILFAILVGRGFRIARLATNPFEKLLAVGIVVFLGTQAFINMSVVIGILPTTGIPLPFVSYGGTALMINLFAVGLLANISTRKT